MILDKENLFSEDQAVTASAASSNVIDHGPGDHGPGTPLEVLAQVVADFNNLTSLTVALQTDDASDFSDPDTLQQSTVALADLVAGCQIPLSTLPNGMKRYSRLYYTVTGTAPTTGKITAGLIWDRQTNGV